MLRKPSARTDPWTGKCAPRRRLLDVGVNAHPIELYAAHIAAGNCLTTVDAIAWIGQRVRLAGVWQTIRRVPLASRSSKKEVMAFLSIEDLEGTLGVLVSPEVFRACRTEINITNPLILESTININAQRGEPVLHAERIWRLSG